MYLCPCAYVPAHMREKVGLYEIVLAEINTILPSYHLDGKPSYHLTIMTVYHLAIMTVYHLTILTVYHLKFIFLSI